MNKYKKLLGNTFVFGVGQVLSKVMSFFIVIVYTRYMTETEYSTADLLYNIVNLLVPLVTLSMSDAVIRFGMDGGYDPRKVYTNAVFTVICGMAVFALFTPLTNAIPSVTGYSFLLYIYLYFSCFRQIASQFVRARGKVKLFMIDGVGSMITQFILNLVFLIGFKMGVTGYILSIVFSDLLSLVCLTLIASLDKCLDSYYIDKKLLGEMIRFSAPLVPTYLIWWVTSASDRFFIINMVGEVENGIYAFGYRIPTLLMMVTTMFYQAWQMSSIEERDSRTLGRFYENVFNAYSSLMFIAASGVIMLVNPLTTLLAGSGDNGTRYHEAFAFTPILIASMLFQCFCQFLSSVYVTKKKSANSCYTALIAAVVNIVLNLLLIPSYGVWGAAIATASSYFACFAVRLFDARKYIFFKVDYFRIAVNTVIIIFMCLLVGKQPSVYVVGLILGFIVCFVYNLDAVLKTLQKLLTRGRTRSTARNANQ